MNPATAAGSLQGPNPLFAILCAVLACGVLDTTAALVVYGHYGRPPMRLLQGIAAGLLGPRSFEGGIATAFAWAFLSLFHRILRRNYLLYGDPLGYHPS